MILKKLIVLLSFTFLLISCNSNTEVQIINQSNHQIRVTLSRKTATMNRIPYDSSYFDNGTECKLTRLEAGKSLILASGTKGDSNLSYQKLGFEKIQIESSTGHITATHTLIATLFHKKGENYVLEVK